jgi:hypothetical protein
MHLKKLRRVGIAAAVLAVVATSAVAAVGAPVDPGVPRVGSLVKAGPTMAANGFPAYYRDSNGVSLEPCLTGDDPLCPAVAAPNTTFDPAQPTVFPTNFPAEFFYQLAKADFNLVDGTRLIADLNVEGGFVNLTTPKQGDQMVFARIRFRDRSLPDGTYRITHPYGMDVFTTAAGNGINYTEDVSPIPGAFGEPLKSRVGPFLKWDPAVDPQAPAGYIGDPGALHAVVGSPYGTNFVKIEKQNPDSSWTIIGNETQFTLQGRVAVNSGVDVDAAVYQTAADGTGFLDVYASSDANQTITVGANAALGTNTTTMVGQGDGRYYARLALPHSVAPGTTITVTNTGDKPPTAKTVPISDLVTVTDSTYHADTQTLTVSATSSDLVNPATLTVPRVDALAPVAGTAMTAVPGTPGAYTVSFANVIAPPATVTVNSSLGGTTTEPVHPNGAGSAAQQPTAVFSIPASMELGQTLNLDGSGSVGDITTYTWAAVDGLNAPAGSFTGQGTATATWSPPATGAYTVSLVVTGPGGASAPVTHTINVTPAAPALVANAGPPQTVTRGVTVKLDGSASTGQTAFSWTQVSGPAVTLTGATTATPSFVYPRMKLPVGPVGHINVGYAVDNAPVVIQLTVSAGATTNTALVTISPTPETYTGLRARLTPKQGGADFRVTGTSSIGTGQTIAMVLGNNPATGKFLGQATTDAAGAFALRLSVPSGPVGVPAPGTVVTIISATGGTATVLVQ